MTTGRDSLVKITGPDGIPISLADLPPRDTVRWVPRRKALVVAAVEGGLISLDDACARYRLSAEEFLGWKRSVARDTVAPRGRRQGER